MLRSRQALPGLMALALAGAPGVGASTKAPDLLPVAEIAASNAAAVVVLRIKVSGEPLARYGSGFLIEPSGTIVTALHLIDRATEVLVRTRDGKRFRRVGIQAYDVGCDLAVLRIDGEQLGALSLGATDDLQSGDPVMLISNPLALSGTVTEGVLGAWRDPLPLPEQLDPEELEEDREFGTRRRLRYVPNTRILQISVPMTHGSSGAPLFDRSGTVVGMAIAGASYGELDLNFAIPTECITPLLEVDEGLTLASLQRRADRDRAELAEHHIENARLALELERHNEALREIDTALQLHPSSAEAQLLEGELLRRNDDLEGAERILLEVTRQDPELAEAWYRLGELYLQRDRRGGASLDRARRALEKALELDKELAEASHSLGFIAFREGRYRSATRLLEDARRANPARAETSIWLGEVHLRMDRRSEARAAFLRSLEMDETDPRSHHGLARAYASVGQDGSAREHYGRFLEITEDMPEHEALRERTILYLQRYPHLLPLEYMDILASQANGSTP